MILVSQLDMIKDVLNSSAFRTKTAFSAKDLDASDKLTEGWQ